MSELVSLLREDEGIRVLWMRDVAGKNALDESFVGALGECFAALAADAEAKVCILRGLPEVFCAGGQLDLLLRMADGDTSVTDLGLARALLEVPQVTIAAMEGHAVGGGLALALCCDVLIAARESRYGGSFMNMGFTPGMGITGLLRDAVGEYLATELLLGGELVKGSRLERSGVNHVLPRAQVYDKAQSLARRIAEKPSKPLRLLKWQLSEGKRAAFDRAREAEDRMHAACFADPATRMRILEGYVGAAR